MSSFWQMFGGIYTLFSDPHIALVRLLLIVIGIAMIYLSRKDILDPLILLPMGMGMIAINAAMLVFSNGTVGNLFINPLISDPNQLMNTLQINFLQPIYTFTFS